MPSDDPEILYLSSQVAEALRSLWRERVEVMFGPSRKKLQPAHDERSQALYGQIRSLGEELYRKGGLELMHAFVRSVNTVDGRCRAGVEDLWLEIPGYVKWERLP